MMYRCALAWLIASTVFAGAAFAQATNPTAQPTQPAQPTPPTPPPMPAQPTAPMPGQPPTPAPMPAQPAAEEPKQPKEPKRGDFDAGGQVRLPSGPDEMGEYAAFNWIALDLKGRYFLLKSVTVNGHIPLAVKKPDMLMTGEDPRLIGGITARLEAMLPKLPKLPGLKYDTEIGLLLSVAYLREGALLLSEKDYPLFTGSFKPGFVVGPIMKVKLSSVVDFSLLPVWMYQSGETESLEAVQIPMSTIIKLGDVVKTSVDLGIYTGDDYSFGGSNGGRISAGASLTLKIGPILAHAGAGVASLLTGGLYPSIRDSVYIDLNVKYAK
ncbi:MAG TPA: hypothetical protein VNO30_13955 [Kofleriaceae bacterium]|nr:hypothetical protein [Kofleriaceae bacterium]